jgi:hypothetical protein
VIVRVERVSKKIMRPSTFIVVKIVSSDVSPFAASFFSGYHRAGMKHIGVFDVYKSTKYTDENCKNVLNFVRR